MRVGGNLGINYVISSCRSLVAGLSVASITPVNFEENRFVTTEEDIPISIILNAPHSDIETISLSLYFQREYMELVGILKDGSVVDEWVDEPSFSDTAQVVKFIGAIHEDTKEDAKKLLTLIFKPLKTGNALIDIVEAELISREGEVVSFEKTSATAIIRNPLLPSPDLNKDGVVDEKDADLFTTESEKGNTTRYDLNQDGQINFFDLNLLMSLYRY